MPVRGQRPIQSGKFLRVSPAIYAHATRITPSSEEFQAALLIPALKALPLGGWFMLLFGALKQPIGQKVSVAYVSKASHTQASVMTTSMRRHQNHRPFLLFPSLKHFPELLASNGSVFKVAAPISNLDLLLNTSSHGLAVPKN